MANHLALSLMPGESADMADLPRLDINNFRTTVLHSIEYGGRIAALFGDPTADDSLRLVAVIARGDTGMLELVSTEVRDGYPALTVECPAAQAFEREIAEQYGVRPEGHPWLKPLRFHASQVPGKDAWDRDSGSPIAPAVTSFFQVTGEEVHAVAVGPVHAGIIEPGHFRFQCHGEHVHHLEIALGYQHRGVERAVVGGPSPRTIHYMETLAGDTSVGHATAYCELMEALAGAPVSARAQVLRGVALELERLANHTGDLGALAGDVGFLPTMSYCGRIRGDFLNMTALICGNRFGRGLIRPGGTGFDVDDDRVSELRRRIEAAQRDVNVAVNLMWDTPSVLARFEETGALSSQTALELGLVGPAARACGLERDVRQEFPTGIFRFVQIPMSIGETGDVFARAFVRWLEIQRSLIFILDELQRLPAGKHCIEVAPPPANRIAVAMVEGWRGEICHVATTDSAGRFSRYKIVDPSFHNWMGLAIALRGQEISDFPLCNKSFSLSYCGHDL